MIKAIKLRIYPNEKQQIQIKKTIGCSRKIYNLMLAERNEIYLRLKNSKDILYDYKYKTESQYKVDYPYLKDADSIALQSSREHMQGGFSHFFNGLKKGRKVGFHLSRFSSLV